MTLCIIAKMGHGPTSRALAVCWRAARVSNTTHSQQRLDIDYDPKSKDNGSIELFDALRERVSAHEVATAREGSTRGARRAPPMRYMREGGG